MKNTSAWYWNSRFSGVS